MISAKLPGSKKRVGSRPDQRPKQSLFRRKTQDAGFARVRLGGLEVRLQS